MYRLDSDDGRTRTAAFGPVLEDFGISGATTVCTAAATFGLVAGSVMGDRSANGWLKKRSFENGDS